MIEETIFSDLSSFAGLSALIATRIYPLRMPQGSTFPAVVYTRVSGARINNLDGENIQNPRYQIDCWAETYSAAKAVAAQIELAFAASSLQAVLIADRDDKDDSVRLYRVSLDYSVWSV